MMFVGEVKTTKLLVTTHTSCVGKVRGRTCKCSCRSVVCSRKVGRLHGVGMDVGKLFSGLCYLVLIVNRSEPSEIKVPFEVY